jgi:membrane protein
LSFDAMLTAVPFVFLLLILLPIMVQVLTGGAAPTPDQLLEPFMPPHQPVQGTDPFEVFAARLRVITAYRAQISLYAIPLFIWFSTRLFAGMRTALNHIFDVSSPPTSKAGVIQRYFLGKARDMIMVFVTLGLFAANTAFTFWLGVVAARSQQAVPELHFFVTTVGRLLGLLVAYGFSLSLFFVLYRFASSRRLGWRPALVAASFAAVAFELAKQLFGWYMQNAAGPARLSVGFNVGAIILFVLWIWYTAVVFLLGGVVAETWKLRALQREQRAMLA